MALAVTSISVLNSTANTATYTPSAFTPTANRLILMWVKVSDPNTAALDPTLSTNPLGFTKIKSVNCTQTNTDDQWVALYAAISSGTPPVGTPVLDFTSSGANMSGCQIDIWEVNGADISGTAANAIVQSPTGTTTGTSLAITLSAAGHSNNRPAACFYHGNITTATTPRTNWTEITDQTQTSPSTYFETQWRSDTFETTASASWTGSIITSGIAIEIKAMLSDVAVTPTTVAATTAVAVPTSAAGASRTPTTVTATTAVNTSTASASASITPTTVVALASVPIPTVSAIRNVSVTPSAVVGLAAMDTPSTTAEARAPPSTIAALAAVSVPSVSTGAALTSSTVVSTTAVVLPNVTAGANVSLQSVGATTSVPIPSVVTTQSVNVTPATVLAVASIDLPTVQTGNDIAVTPGTVTGSAQVEQPAVSTGASLVAVTVATSTAVDVPVVTAAATITPLGIATSTDVPGVSVATTENVEVTPTTVLASTGVPEPVVQTGGDISLTPDTVQGVGVVQVPSVAGGADVISDAVGGSTTVPTPSVSATGTEDPHVPRGFEVLAEIVREQRAAGVATIRITVTGTARVQWWIDEEDLRQRVRDHLSNLVG